MQLTVKGQTAYIYTGGKTFDRKLPAVVFLHGAQLDHSCWNLQSRWLGHHGFGVLAVDLPGHGRSNGVPLSSIGELAQWVAALLSSLELERAALIGHSMGSLIAIETALQFPKQVQKLALLGSTMPMPVSAALLDASSHNEPKAIAMVNSFSHSSSAQIGGNPVPGLWMMGMNQRLMERQKPGVFGCDMNACNAYSRPLTDLSAISQPTLILAGAQDRMTPPKASRALGNAIAGARVEVLAGAGHAMMAEQPDTVLNHLRDFLKQ
ncbi:MAG: alpha/beta hydrolase [Betaproteobacteria bacterium]|nr:alpha/beta hydrolase [Betaproteobacteria bacterium]